MDADSRESGGPIKGEFAVMAEGEDERIQGDVSERAEDVAVRTAGVVSVMNNLRVRQPGGTGATG
jgi:hypothetical protein